MKFIGIYTAYILHPHIPINMVKAVQCSKNNFFQLFAALGNHVHAVLASDDGDFFIVISDEITPEIRRILGGELALKMTPERIKILKGNTPMNFRDAIQNGNLSHPGRKYQHLWEAVCEKAGVVKLTYPQQVANAALTFSLYALWGAVKAVEAVSSLHK